MMGFPYFVKLPLCGYSCVFLLCYASRVAGLYGAGGVARESFDIHSLEALEHLERIAYDYESTRSSNTQASDNQEEVVWAGCKPEQKILMSVFDTLTTVQRNKLFKEMQKRRWFTCIRSPTGHTKYFGLPAVTKSRAESERRLSLANMKSIHKKEETRERLGAQISDGTGNDRKTCELVSLEHLIQINRPYLDMLLKMCAFEEYNHLQEHMHRLYQNKLSGYSRDGRDQLASPEGMCWERAYVPIYVSYVLGVMRKKEMVEGLGRTEMMRWLDILENHEEHRTRLSVSTRSLNKSNEVTKRAMENIDKLKIAQLFDFDGFSRWTEPNIGDFHPICQTLIMVSRTLMYNSLESCCSQCYGELCEARPEESSLLQGSEVWSLEKTTSSFEVKYFRLTL